MAAWLTVTFMVPPLLLILLLFELVFETGCVAEQTGAADATPLKVLATLELIAIGGLDGGSGFNAIATTPLLPTTGAGLPAT